jgi:hypothetical protein
MSTGAGGLRHRSAAFVGALGTALCAAGCLWDTALGEVAARDAGPPTPDQAIRDFAEQLVGDWVGTAGSPNVPVALTFRADGSYSATCLAPDLEEYRRACPFLAMEGDGSYQLTAVEASGDVDAVTWDTYYGVEAMSRLDYMRLSDGGNTLTYLRVATIDGGVADLLRDAGVSDFLAGSGNLARNYIVLKRAP